MRKIAIIFILTVVIPSLGLAWLAVRSLQDQQFIIERQQALLYQGVVDKVARDAVTYIDEQQQVFSAQVENLLQTNSPANLAVKFDEAIRTNWPMAEIGFAVSLEGRVMCPQLNSRPDARQFRIENDRFLCNAETAEVYWNAKGGNAILQNGQGGISQNGQVSQMPAQSSSTVNAWGFKNSQQQQLQSYNQQAQVQKRNVNPQSRYDPQQQLFEAQPQTDNYSKIQASEADFRQLIGDANEGIMSRFLQNRLNVMTWYRSPRNPTLVYGAKLDLHQLTEGLRSFVTSALNRELENEICLVLLDDSAKPIGRSHSDFVANWKRPFVAAEIGEALPHWEIALYLLNPKKLSAAAVTLKITLSLLIALLLLAIFIGGWLIVRDLDRELRLARQKTDFVSNVSHELKTPLTSIRMFAELLADGRVKEPDKQKNYLNIITTESARLTRLINNVLDFARMERGEKKYQMRKVDLNQLVSESVDAYRAHLEAAGFHLELSLPDTPVSANGDPDALAQIIVNLLSNAEKYSDSQREISVELSQASQPFAHAEIRVMDRGPGISKGYEEKVFEKFFRANDSLSSGIQGSGLGLTLARQIARTHGGELTYTPRSGGGSCFILKLPILPPSTSEKTGP